MECPDNKIEMPCSCLPDPPDKPLPFVFPLFNTTVVDYSQIGFQTHFSNPGKVGINTGLFSLPNYTSHTLLYLGFSHTIPIIIDPPPGFPGPGLVQATATMSIDSLGSVTITMTNTGSGYPSSTSVVNYTLGNYFTFLKIKTVHVPTPTMGTPVALLSYPLPIYPNITFVSNKIIPQLCCSLEFSSDATYPIDIIGEWYVNGIATGDFMHKSIISEGKKQIVHYGIPKIMNYADTIDYKITCANPDLKNASGNVLYYIQYI